MSQPATLLETPPILRAFRLLSVFLFLATLGVLFHLGYQAGLEAGRLMLQAGWGKIGLLDSV